MDSVPSSFSKLGEVAVSISEGVHTGCNRAFFIEQEEAEQKKLEKELLKPILKGKDVKRFEKPDTELRCIYPYDASGQVISASKLESDFPNVWSHLVDHRERLEDRTYVLESGKEWYEIWCERNIEIFSNPKILTPDIAERNQFTIDVGEQVNYFNTKVKSIKLELDEETEYMGVLGVLNSSLLTRIYRGISPPKSGGFRSYTPGFLSDLRIPTTGLDDLSEATKKMIQLKGRLSGLNLSLLDHLGAYDDGSTLADVGFTQPPKNVADSILQETTEQRPNLRVGHAEVHRESDSTVEVRLTARYKPDDDAHETDQWGYTETEAQPALRLTDLSPAEANLIEAFVPLAVDKAGGFAGFRETATKTNSLVDRLRGLRLPQLADVRDGLESYSETKARAEELEAKIERTDDLIDDIVYELYGLTDEEIEIVEEATME